MMRRLLVLAPMLLSAGCGLQQDRVADRDGSLITTVEQDQTHDAAPPINPSFDLAILSVKENLVQSKYRAALSQIENIDSKTHAEKAIQLVLMGQCFEALDDSANAFSAYQQAQSSDPTLAVAMLREGVLSLRQGDLDRALLLLQRYAKQDASSPEVYFYLYRYAVLLDFEMEQQAEFFRKLLVADGPRGPWMARLHQGTVSDEP